MTRRPRVMRLEVLSEFLKLCALMVVFAFIGVLLGWRG